jgi:hypothetical protein
MPYGTVNADVIQTSTSGGILGAGNASIMKNRIINGAMVIDQRNAGASVTASGYSLDRWGYYGTQASKFTIQQNAGSVTPPVGFTNYLGLTSSSAYSVTSTDFFEVYQSIEGVNIADLGWGTSNAKTVTLSFQVRSSLTGSFGGFLTNSSGNRIYPFSYTISSANTWTSISLTIAGDTTGTWLTNTSTGIQVAFGLGVGSTFNGTAGAWNAGSNQYIPSGSVSVVGTSGATFYITGVQLEVGSSATGYEYRLYNQELSACQRYAYRFLGTGVQTTLVGSGGMYSSSQVEVTVTFPVTMRTTPSTTIANGTDYWRIVSNGTNDLFNNLSSTEETPVNALLYSSSGASGTQGYSARVDTLNSNASILFSAEL